MLDAFKEYAGAFVGVVLAFVVVVLGMAIGGLAGYAAWVALKWLGLFGGGA